VTTVAGNQSVEKNTKNALNVLEVMGRDDISVSVGATRPGFSAGTSGSFGPSNPLSPCICEAKDAGLISGRVAPTETLISQH
jgi:pyrimidine-specific ribonucleoside hydrolase